MDKNTAVYMEVYGVNRIIYRVTASVIKRKGRNTAVYGVSLEDMRTGDAESLEDFSDDMEKAIDFAHELVHKKARPYMLYSEALRHLRFSPDSMFSVNKKYY